MFEEGDMVWAEVYDKESTRALPQYVAALKQAVERRGFIINNEERMSLADSFSQHGIATASGFDMHLIQVCKPEKAAASLQANPERAALMPKCIAAFSRNGRTRVRFLMYHRPMIETLVTNDPAFADSLAESYTAIRAMIDEAC